MEGRCQRGPWLDAEFSLKELAAGGDLPCRAHTVACGGKATNEEHMRSFRQRVESEQASGQFYGAVAIGGSQARQRRFVQHCPGRGFDPAPLCLQPDVE